MEYRVISIKAPPAPECFESRMQWLEYLSSAQAAGKVKPFDKDGEYRPTFGFCSDCSAQHAHAMHKQGKCRPHQYQQNLLMARQANEEHATTTAEPSASTT